MAMFMNAIVASAVMFGLGTACCANSAGSGEIDVAAIVRDAHKITWSDQTQPAADAHTPGPAMWKVTRGASTIWILGVLEETPQDLNWDSSRLREALSGARALIVPGNTVESDDAKREWYQRSKIPPGGTRREYISVTAQNRFERLVRSEDHLGQVGGFLPVRFGIELNDAVRANHHIGLYQLVRDVELFPEARGLPKIVPFTISGDALLKGWLNLSTAGDNACLLDAFDDIDWDLNILPGAAQAWAAGDIPAVERDYRSPPGLVCRLLVPGWEQQYETYSVDTMAKTLEMALSAPGKTVALVPFGDLVRKGGVLDRLQSDGVAIAPSE